MSSSQLPFRAVEAIPPSQQGQFLRRKGTTVASKYDPYLTAVLAAPGRVFEIKAPDKKKAGLIAQSFRNLLKKRKVTHVTVVSRGMNVYLEARAQAPA